MYSWPNSYLKYFSIFEIENLFSISFNHELFVQFNHELVQLHNILFSKWCWIYNLCKPVLCHSMWKQICVLYICVCLEADVCIYVFQRNFKVQRIESAFSSVETYPDECYTDRQQSATHPGTGEEPIVCKYCGQVFSWMKSMRAHVKTIHFKQFRHYCRVCAKGFNWKKTLETHMSTNHNMMLEWLLVLTIF